MTFPVNHVQEWAKTACRLDLKLTSLDLEKYLLEAAFNLQLQCIPITVMTSVKLP